CQVLACACGTHSRGTPWLMDRVGGRRTGGGLSATAGGALGSISSGPSKFGVGSASTISADCAGRFDDEAHPVSPKASAIPSAAHHRAAVRAPCRLAIRGPRRCPNVRDVHG